MQDKIGQDIEPGDLLAVAHGSDGAALDLVFADRLTKTRVYVIKPASTEVYKWFDKCTGTFVDECDWNHRHDFEYRSTGRRRIVRSYYQHASNRIVKIDLLSLKKFNVDSFVADWLRDEHGKVIRDEFIGKV